MSFFIRIQGYYSAYGDIISEEEAHMNFLYEVTFTANTDMDTKNEMLPKQSEIGVRYSDVITREPSFHQKNWKRTVFRWHRAKCWNLRKEEKEKNLTVKHTIKRFTMHVPLCSQLHTILGAWWLNKMADFTKQRWVCVDVCKGKMKNIKHTVYINYVSQMYILLICSATKKNTQKLSIRLTILALKPKLTIDS